MARPYISAELRKLVAERADFLCEYCLISDADRVSGCQVDHIISVKHGGATSADNLCYACIFCNLQKGTDLLNTTQSSYSFNHSNNSLDLSKIWVKTPSFYDGFKLHLKKLLTPPPSYPQKSTVSLRLIHKAFVFSSPA